MELFYRKIGQGKPLFILHGLFGLSDNWTTVGKLLSEFFEVYLIDLRNHGYSPHSDDWSYPLMATDIFDLASKHKSVSIMGHSLGGKVAMQFASMYPEKTDKLIVVDIAPKKYPSNQFNFIEKLLSINLSVFESRKEVETELVKIIKDQATIQLLLKNIHWNDKNKLAWKFNLKVIAENQNKINNSFSIEKNIITIPSLFIRGEKSDYILDTDIPNIEKLFSNSKFTTILEAGHWVHADKPKEFTETLVSWISVI